MRPYLAILKDSFREALASRVLWIVIILTTVVLIAAAPLGLKEEKSVRLHRNSVRNWSALVAKIDEQRRAEGPSPGKQVWNRWSSELKGQLAQAEEESPGNVPGELVSDLVDEMNRVVSDPTFYDVAAWQAIDPGEEASELLKRPVGSLGGDEVVRLNRLLLRAAFPAQVPKDESSEIYVSYLVFKPFGTLPITRQQMTPVVKAVLAIIVDYAVGVFAVFAAILVTASIIPQTFEAGAIDLLLSKPVSRTLVFLTKFLGGCAFIALIAGYLILGLWLIAGLRFEIWSHKLFLCIPVILFLFAIYYSVSALAGVLWRNAIVSVIVSIIFWAICFGVWGAKSYAEVWWISPERIVRLIPAGQTLLAVTEPGKVQNWRPKDATWEEVFAADDQGPRPGGFVIRQPMIGPVYDAGHERLVALQGPSAAGGFGLFGPSPALLLGARKDGWTQKKGPAPPAGALALFVNPRNEVVVVNRAAVFRLLAPNAGTNAGADVKPKGKAGKFVRSGPDRALGLDATAAAAMDPDTGAIAVFNQGVVTLLETDESGKYQRKLEKEIAAAKDSKAVLIACGGKYVLLALGDGRILVLDRADLEVRHETRPVGDNPPQFVAASPGGRWLAVLFQKRTLWLYDARAAQAAHRSIPSLSITGQGNISAVAFDGPDRLLAADRGKRVTRYKIDPFQIEETRAGPLSTVEMGYYYGLIPLYAVFPKPGELGSAVRYLLTDKEEDPGDQGPRPLVQRQPAVDVAGPVWSSLVFLAVMLTLSCLYVWRSDF